ncbi:hypothetical protein [uncultured Kordia sp.]|uniref:hypothetical protein n=1 Tax=uncultured Kordia sp. TaxID=507699 RepID=UPI00261CBBAF|nr:hypothetical protein [uncultured Kordia sp.]
MKKQKKLNLGKIKIAGINNTHSIIGGVDSVAGVHTYINCQTNEQGCVTQRYCNTYDLNICATTTHTKAESDACGGTHKCEDTDNCGQVGF